MDITEALKSFVATAQTGSFTKGAAQLGISNRLTSKYVAELERRLGIRVFQRTTRRIGLTPAGEELLARAPALLDELELLLSDVSDAAPDISGLIRLSASVTFGELCVAPMLARFAARHPEISVDLRLSDDHVDLASDGLDLAFRIGESARLTVKARKLATMRPVIAASPDYLARHGTPATPADLANHACIIDTNRKTPQRWQLDANVTAFDVTSRFRVNSARAAAELAVAGCGLTFAPRFVLQDHLDSGALTSVLSQHITIETPISIVYLEGQTLPRKIRTLIEFAVADFRDHPLF